MSTYRVRITRLVTDILEAYIDVEAASPEAAEEIALERAPDIELSYHEQADAEDYEAIVCEENGKPLDAI